MKKIKIVLLALIGSLMLFGCSKSDEKEVVSSAESKTEAAQEESIEKPANGVDSMFKEEAEKEEFDITGKWIMAEVEGGYVEFYENNTGIAGELGTEHKVAFVYEVDLKKKMVSMIADGEEEIVTIEEKDGVISLLDSSGSAIVREEDYYAAIGTEETTTDYSKVILGKWYTVDPEDNGETYIELREDNTAVLHVPENGEDTIAKYSVDSQEKIVLLYDSDTGEEVVVNIVEADGKLFLQNAYDTCIHESYR